MELQQTTGTDHKNGTAKEITKAAQGAKQTDGKPEAVKAETGKVEPPKVEPAKPAVKLEDTLRAVDDLHRKSIQRHNLIARIAQLEAFEVTLAKENDELEDNPYQGCKLIIEDDKHRQFVTTTPGLIRLTSQFIFNACLAKKAEIESLIVFPGV